MANDLVTRLLLNSSQFDNNIIKSTKQVQEFQNMAKNITGTIAKFAGGLGLAMGASEAFNKTIAGSQTLTDTFSSGMEMAKSSVDTFFNSLAMGDFSNFSTNMQNAINLAREYYREMDTLGSMNLFKDNNIGLIQNQMARDRNVIKDKNSTKEEIKAALASLKEQEAKLKALTIEYGEQAQKTYYAALRKVIAEQGGGEMTDKQLELSFGSFEQYDEKVRQFNELEAKRKAAQTKQIITLTSNYGTAMSYEVAADTDESRAIANSEEYKQLRAIAQAHDDNIKKAKEYQKLAITAESQLIAAEGANLKGFNKEITGNKEEKINIGFNLHYTEVDALLNPDGILLKMRKDGIIIPVSLDLQEADVDEELISRNDVKLNNEYAESLFLMGTALNSISGATLEGASAWLSYSASVVGGIASMLPALASVFGFTAALGIAEQSKIPFPMNIIAMTATGVGLAATIASLPKFASGGIFAGNSSIGDMNLARVNSGEMILNHSQQGRLFNILDGRGTLDNAASGGQVEFKIKGRNLEGALKKNTKINNRIR